MDATIVMSKPTVALDTRGRPIMPRRFRPLAEKRRIAQSVVRHVGHDSKFGCNSARLSRLIARELGALCDRTGDRLSDAERRRLLMHAV